MEFQYFKLEIFIPETHFRALQKALQQVDAGHIGNYDSCLSYSPVTGTWRPLAGTNQGYPEPCQLCRRHDPAMPDLPSRSRIFQEEQDSQDHSGNQGRTSL